MIHRTCSMEKSTMLIFENSMLENFDKLGLRYNWFCLMLTRNIPYKYFKSFVEVFCIYIIYN